MELEEMKERWAALNDRLERTEMLQESVIRELVQTKGEKSVSRLINWETFGFVVTILIIPYSIYVYHRFGGHFAMWDLFIRVAIVVDGLLVLWTGYKLYGLMKIDFTKVVKENILRVNRYTVQITREKIFTAAIIGPLFVILSVVMSIEMKAPDFIWGVLFGVVVATTVACYWLYKRCSIRISLTSVVSSSELCWTSELNSSFSSSSNGRSGLDNNCENPTMAFSGVRIS